MSIVGCIHKSALLAFGLCTLAGCAVGPNFHRPEKPHSTSYTAHPMPKKTVSTATKHGKAQVFVAGKNLPTAWWRVFHDESLNHLVEASLQANPDVMAASEALKIAHANTKVEQTAFFPMATASYNPSRQLTAGTLSSVLASSAYLYTVNTTNVSVYYMPDVLGFTRRQVETAKAYEESEGYQAQAVYLTLAANVVLAAIQEASLRAQMMNTKKAIYFAREIMKLFEKQLTLGAVSQADVAAQAMFLAQTEALLPSLEQQLETTRHLLASLRGVSPNQDIPETFHLSDFTLPTHLPLKLPSQLVDERPDVRAAEAGLHAMSAQIGVAIANRLPKIMLSGNAGTVPVSFSPSSIPPGSPFFASTGTLYWMIAGNLLGTVFDAGALKQKQQAAEATYRLAEAQYRRVVLNAFQNVADSLKAIEYDAKALNLARKQERAAYKGVEIIKHAFPLGAASQYQVIAAEQAYQQSLANLAQAQATRFADTVSLFQALGGGGPLCEQNLLRPV